MPVNLKLPKLKKFLNMKTERFKEMLNINDITEVS